MNGNLNAGVGKEISETQCQEWCDRYWASDHKVDIQWTFFGREALQKMLGSEYQKVEGIKVRTGMDEKNDVHFILTACDSKGSPIVSFQFGMKCPPFC